ncbi:MAG: hypothetical protein E7345_00465 [Clostridiales bacterium]|nr:hypothetical protein [Clostridiales bacterium]
MKLLEYINNKTDNAYKDYKLVSVIFDETNLECVFKFLYKNEITDEDKNKLHDLVSEYINQEHIKIIIKCKKAYLDEDLVNDVIYNFIFRNYTSVTTDFKKECLSTKIESGEIYTTITCNKFQYNYLSSDNVKKEICDYASNFFFEDFYIDFSLIDGEVSIEEIDEVMISNLYSQDDGKEYKYAKVSNIEKYIGEVNGCPLEMSGLDTAMQNVEIAGTIKFFQQRSFESKRKDKDGNAIERIYFSFTLASKSGRMNCVLFPLKADMVKAFNLKDDIDVLLHGDIEEFNGRINFKVKGVAFCKIEEDVQVEENINIITEPNEKYVFVKPEQYVEISQDNLFDIKQEDSEYLLNNDVVVFDIETTGLEATRCEIIEIGAVKIHKGKITETFETLIKPVGEIPDEIIDLTGITPSMVVNSPSFKQVIPDFFKFCYGTVIMAYNIDFDYKFISVHSKKCGYEFNMKQVDVLYLARAFVPGLKNFKLGTVCKKLGVSLENAHRAVHDAMATAEVVIKLGRNLDKM